MSTATKEKATHTKGPWHYGPPQGRDYTEVPICSTIQEPGEYFATVHFTGDGDETDANARLIAAAPCLLEATKDVCVMLESEDNAISISMRLYYKALKAAIAKAEGK